MIHKYICNHLPRFEEVTIFILSIFCTAAIAKKVYRTRQADESEFQSSNYRPKSSEFLHGFVETIGSRRKCG